MAYRLDTQKPLSANVCQIVGEQLERAATELSSQTATPKTIHETRKCIKRIRAVLKLVRPGVSKTWYAKENARFRDIAALLAPSRDTDILDETTLKLDAQSDRSAQAAIAATRKLIGKTKKRTSPTTEQAVSQARQAIAGAARDYRTLTIDTDSFLVLRDGLQSCYGAARRAQKLAYRDGTDKTFHDWRKPVQLHWRHMALFSNAWPEMFKARVEAARTLSQILGDDHDLSILISFVRAATKKRDLTEDAARKVKKYARARQQVLRDIANPLGGMLFQQSAKNHAHHIYGIWLASMEITGLNEQCGLKDNAIHDPRSRPPATTDAS